MPTPSSNLTVYHDIESGKHRQQTNLSDLAISLGENYCATLLVMYVFSGEDCASAFKGNGEGEAREKSWRSTPGFIKRSGNSVRNGTSSITCWNSWKSSPAWCTAVPRYFDGCPPCAKLRKIVVEDEKLTSISKIDLVRFPPCHSALKPHTM